MTLRTPQKLLPISALVASVTVILSSILCLAFKMTAYSSYICEIGGGNTFKPPGHGSLVSESFKKYPKHLIPVTSAPLVVAGSFGLITGLAATCLIIWVFKTRKALQLSFRQRIALILILCVNALLDVISMIYTLVQYGRSAHFGPKYVMTAPIYDQGLFSLEAWACEAPQYIEGLKDHELRTQCVGEKGSRIMVVVLCFFSLAVLGFLVGDLETTQVMLAKKKMRMRRSWGNEAQKSIKLADLDSHAVVNNR